MHSSSSKLSLQTPPPTSPDGGVQKLAIHGGELLTSSKVNTVSANVTNFQLLCCRSFICLKHRTHLLGARMYLHTHHNKLTICILIQYCYYTEEI